MASRLIALITAITRRTWSYLKYPLLMIKPSSPPSSDSNNGKTRRASKPSKKATIDELRGGLAALGLETKGKKETLWRRLCNACTRSEPSAIPSSIRTDDTKSEGEVEKPRQKYTSFLCFDVEATCHSGKGDLDYPNEVIEFPVVLLRWVDEGRSKLERIDTFHSYVRPTWRPTLTDFCISLTGITQEKVDSAHVFPEVLQQLEAWLDKHGLKDGDELRDAMWVTDGPWDLRDFVAKQLHITPANPPRYPAYFLPPYLNIKQAVQTVLGETWRREQYAKEHPTDPPNTRAMSIMTTAMFTSKRKAKGDKPKGPDFRLTITGQVEALGLGDFAGRQHSGLDDAINISRVLMALADRGVLIEPNARLPQPKNAKQYPWMDKPGVVKWEDWMSVPRRPAAGVGGTDVKHDDESPLQWKLVEDAAGRMKAVKRPSEDGIGLN